MERAYLRGWRGLKRGGRVSWGKMARAMFYDLLAGGEVYPRYVSSRASHVQGFSQAAAARQRLPAVTADNEQSYKSEEAIVFYVPNHAF